MQAVFSVRSAATADASLADILERIKFGIAMAAMIKIIATTINNSINEKPFCCSFICPILQRIRVPTHIFFGSRSLAKSEEHLLAGFDSYTNPYNLREHGQVQTA